MSLAVMSALSLICLDGALAARPAAVAPVITPVVMAAAAAQDATPITKIAPPEALPEAEEVTVEEVFNDPLVFAEDSDDAVAAKLISYIENLDTMQGDFTQVAPSGAISDGKFYLRRPGFLRFDYEPPTPLLLVANGGMVYVHDDSLDTTDSYPVGKTPLKFLLGKKIDLDDAKVVQVDRGVDNVAVTFSSTDEETEGEITLIATAPDFVLRRWIVRDLQGGTTVVTLNNVESGMKIATSLFRAPDAGGRFLDR